MAIKKLAQSRCYSDDKVGVGIKFNVPRSGKEEFMLHHLQNWKKEAEGACREWEWINSFSFSSTTSAEAEDRNRNRIKGWVQFDLVLKKAEEDPTPLSRKQLIEMEWEIKRGNLGVGLPVPHLLGLAKIRIMRLHVRRIISERRCISGAHSIGVEKEATRVIREISEEVGVLPYHCRGCVWDEHKEAQKGTLYGVQYGVARSGEATSYGEGRFLQAVSAWEREIPSILMPDFSLKHTTC